MEQKRTYEPCRSPPTFRPLPLACGGVPMQILGDGLVIPFIPLLRGCASPFAGRELSEQLFPRVCGMYHVQDIAVNILEAFPHTRRGAAQIVEMSFA